jgi:hypothetical protein
VGTRKPAGGNGFPERRATFGVSIPSVGIEIGPVISWWGFELGATPSGSTEEVTGSCGWLGTADVVGSFVLTSTGCAWEDGTSLISCCTGRYSTASEPKGSPGNTKFKRLEMAKYVTSAIVSMSSAYQSRTKKPSDPVV